MNISELKQKIENANALGVSNLTEQGVEISESATTYEIMTAIAEIVSSGGGITYTSIVYNEDDTITLTDKDGVGHTMSCTYEDDKLVGVTFDGKNVELAYDGDVLVKVGKTAVDMANAPVNIVALDHTVKFMVDGEPYEVVSVKDGNVVNEPIQPIKDNQAFVGWKIDVDTLNFPYTPTSDCEINATFSSLVNTIYDTFGVDKSVYKHILLYVASQGVTIVFATTGFYKREGNYPRALVYDGVSVSITKWDQPYLGDGTDFRDIVQHIKNYGSAFTPETTLGIACPIGVVYCTFDISTVIPNYIPIL